MSENAPRTDNSPQLTAWRRWADFAASVAIVASAAVFIWRSFDSPSPRQTRDQPPQIAVPDEPLSLEGAWTKGVATAPVGIVGFSDFECPYCADFSNRTMPYLDSQYISPGLVLFAFRQLPIVAIHANAMRAAEASVCAGEQGQFWRFHDFLFSQSTRLSLLDMPALGEQLDIGTPTFFNCLTTGRRDHVERDLAIASTLGITGTPAFFVGNVNGNTLEVAKVLLGSVSREEFDATIAGLLPNSTEP